MTIVSLTALPEVLSLEIFSFFTPPELIGNIKSVSKLMHMLSNHALLWKSMAMQLRINPGQNSKQAVLLKWKEYAETNTIFITCVDYIRQQIAKQPNLFTRYVQVIPPNPSGRHAYELYQNILKWCVSSMEKLETSNGLIIYKSKTLNIMQRFWSQRRHFPFNRFIPPDQFKDPRLHKLFHVSVSKIHGTEKRFLILSSF